jgi:ribA/ribD-fused uncharacterized protein
MSEQILFYGRSKPFYCGSNFYPAPIKLDGKVWATTEHYFQAMKFLDQGSQDLVRIQPSPDHAAKVGRSKDMPLRRDWESARDDVMRKAIKAKFTQHEDLKQELLATGEAELVEDSPVDWYWGWGADRKGKNRLGVLLMELRKELRETLVESV